MEGIENKKNQHLIGGLNKAREILNSLISEIIDYGLPNSSIKENTPNEITIENIINRFDIFARKLKHRERGRDPLLIEDEYDLQYIFHALLNLHFSDIRPEEFTPSHAGANSRLDFLLKNEKIIIELKKTRNNLSDKQLGEQLIIDIERYKSHPDFKKVIFFVYDPDHIIKNPHAIENDLSKREDNLDIRVFIRPN